MTDYKEYLDVAVIQENRPVTYKSMARSLGIHVNTAKQALYEYSNENQDKVHAVYCITGTTTKTNQFSIQLVKASEVDDAKKTFKNITGVHVYSVTSFTPDDFSILYSACKDAPKISLEERIQCGILKNKDVFMKSPVKTEPVKKDANIVENPYIKPTTAAAETIPAKTTTPAAKRKGTLNFGPVVKKQATKSTSAKPVAKPVDTKKKGKNEHDEIERKMAKTKITASDIFSDDEDEQIEERQLEEEDDVMILEDSDDEQSKAEKVEEKADEDFQAPPPAPMTPGKVRKQVLKKVTTRNARGLLVTEEVMEWEEVDASEAESSRAPAYVAPAKPKASAPSKPKSTAKKPTQQTNLFSFFKKQ